MVTDANPPGRGADDARFEEISEALADAVEAVIGPWVARLVTTRIREHRGQVDAGEAAAAGEAGEAARREIVPELRALLRTDLDQQRSNPLALLRRATKHAHAALADAGVPPVVRDEFSERSFPDDTYGLVPAAWDDIDPSLREIGITWGAAKAFVFKARRRAEGRS